MIFSSLRIRDNSKNRMNVFTEDFPKSVIIQKNPRGTSDESKFWKIVIIQIFRKALSRKFYENP